MKQQSRRVLSLVVSLILLLTQISGMTVLAEESEIVSITATATQTLIENVDGWWTWDYDDDGNRVDWFHYTPVDTDPTITVTYKDGRTVTGDLWDIEAETGFRPYFLGKQSYDAQWTVGKHTATVDLLGEFEDPMGLASEFEVEVVENPIASVTATATQTLIADVDGWWDWDYDDNGNRVDWFRYDPEDTDPTITVTYKDGRTFTGDRWDIEEGTGYWPSLSDDQRYYAPWTVGKHTATVEVLGVLAEFEVEVVENPIASVTATATQTLIEHVNGSWNTNYDDGNRADWFCYELMDTDPTITVTYKDGHTVTGARYEIEDKTGYWPSFSSEQSYDAPWTVGKHTATVEVMGVSGEFEVEVVENPIASVAAIATQTLIENVNGSWTWDYDDDGNEVDWFYYDVYNVDPTITVTYKDGRIVTGTRYEIEDKTGYWPSFSSNQSYDTPWTVGKHTATVEVMGVSGEFDVEVVENPIASVTAIATKTLIENGNGSWTWDYDDDGNEVDWYCYDPEDTDPTITVTYKDGRIVTGTRYEIEEETGYWPSFSSNQSYDAPWTVGKHTATVEVMGVSGEFEVEIVDSPVVSIELLNIGELKANIDGYWGYGDSYFSYDYPAFTMKVTYRDGSTKLHRYDEARFPSTAPYMDDFQIRISSNQAEQPWTAGGDNLFTVEYLGATAQGKATIVETSDFEYFIQDNGVIITDYRLEMVDKLDIPEKIAGLPVVGINALGYIKITQLTIPASVQFISDGAFDSCYELEHISVAEGNRYYSAIDGVLYNAAADTLVYYPWNRGSEYTVPASVSNIDSLNKYERWNLTISFSPDSTAFRTVDGVTYTADMKKVVYCDKNKSGSYTMPNSVVEIADAAFMNCNNLTRVSVSNSVTDIAYYAFVGCESLAQVDLPQSVITLDGYSFSECSSLKQIDLPESLVDIEDYAFNRSGLTSIDIPDSVKKVGNSAFGYTPLATVTIGKGIESIGSYAFNGCDSLAKVTIGNSAVEIWAGAFRNCPLTQLTIGNKVQKISDITFYGETYYSSDITKISIPNSVTAIAYGAFSGCGNLTDINIPDSVISIGGIAFDGTKWYNEQPEGTVYIGKMLYEYKGKMESSTTIDVKAGTLGIADYAFANYSAKMSGLTKVNLPDGLLHIGDYAFYNCNKLNTINIPDSVQSIDYAAFYGCDSLTSITISASVSSIADYAFANCDKLSQINVAADNPYFASEDGVLYNKDKTELIFCPAGKTGRYTIPESVVRVCEGAFAGSQLVGISIKNAETILEDCSIGVSVGLDYYNPLKWKNQLIRGYAGSSAEAYAKTLGLDFVVLPESGIEYGNVTADSEEQVVANDALITLQSATGKVQLSEDQRKAADVSGDGSVDAQDALLVLQYFTRKIVVFPVELM